MKLKAGQLILFRKNARWTMYDGRYHHPEDDLRILEGTICLVLDVKSMPVDRDFTESEVVHTLIQTPNGVAWIPNLEWHITDGVISLL